MLEQRGPFRRRDWQRCDPFVTERTVFREDSVFPRVVYGDVSTLLGSSIPTTSLISQRAEGVPVTVVPRGFAVSSSSVNLSSLLQRARVQPAPRTMALARHGSRAPSRVSFPIATTSRRVNSLNRFLRPAHRVNATRRPRCSAHDVLHVLDGLLLSKTCEFISPHCHVRDSAFRGLCPV